MTGAGVDLRQMHAQHDRDDMLGRVTSFPRQMREAWSIGRAFAPDVHPGDYRRVLVCGMGGSAIGGDMLRSFFGDRLRIPLVVRRDYHVPARLAEGAFVVISSYSGNTGETLSAYDAVRAAGATAVAVSSGGELEERCRRDGVPFCRIPPGMPPRSALAYSFLPMTQILRAAEAASFEDEEFDEAVEAAERRARECALDAPSNPAVELAVRLVGKVPFVYSGPGLYEAVARRWACQFNENAKTIAHVATYPELNHNEIVGWEVLEDVLGRVVVLSLEDHEDHSMTRLQADIGLGIIAPLASGVVHYGDEAGGRLARLVSTTLLGDFASVYLALVNGVDPTPVRKIDRLKERVKEEGGPPSPRKDSAS